MTVLGIDTSAVVCSVALLSEGEVLCEKTLSNGLTHSETLLPTIKEVLCSQNKKLEDLDCIAISSGPGSFTGLRIGISTVKGLAIAYGIPCFPASTLEALAMNASEYEGKIICAVMDARRGEFYNAIFKIENGIPVRICPDRAIPGTEIFEEISGKDYVILGDGAEKFAEQNPESASHLAPCEIRRQSGASVAKTAQLSENCSKFISCQALSPSYIRIPQAEREYLKNNSESEK